MDNNKLIAKFMGFKSITNATIRTTKEYDYRIITNYEISLFQTSWDWLMPVVEKIESLEGGKLFSVFIVGNGCDIAISTKYRPNGEDWDAPSFRVDDNTKLDATYKSVTSFINWHQNQ